MDEIPEEERLEFVRSYGVEPVTDINTDLTLDEAATFVAEMTPIVGDAMAAKEIYDELMEEEPNYPLIAALGGTAIVGAIPGIGDAASAGMTISPSLRLAGISSLTFSAFEPRGISLPETGSIPIVLSGTSPKFISI